jgi:general secretion pathway protein A
MECAMYNAFFEFQEKPFKLVPNPEFLYLSKSHEIALAHLTYAVEQGDGFVVITGEVGTGKTTLCRNFLERLNDLNDTAYIFNPRLAPSELLASICSEFGLYTRETSTKSLLDTLYDYLILKNKQGHKVILLIDEAQSLSIENLEMVRMLSNLETSRNKLLQIVLVGQPELSDTLDSYELRQLAQRVSLGCYLSPLTAQETEGYIKHRINIAAQRQVDLFSSRACKLIHQHANGIPRLINIIADRCLLTAFSLDHKRIGAAIAQAAIKEIAGRGRAATKKSLWHRRLAYGGTAGLIVLFVAGVGVATVPWVRQHLTSAGFPNQHTIRTATGHGATPSVSQETVAGTTETPEMPPPTQSDALQQKSSNHDAVSTQTGADGKNAITAQVAPSFSEEPAQSPEQATPAGKSSSGVEIEDLEHAIRDLEHTSSRFEAVSALLAQWQQSGPHPNQIPAVSDDRSFFEISARQYGLRLYCVENDWALVERLNLPAMVALIQKTSPSPVYLTMVGRHDRAILLSDGKDDRMIETTSDQLKPFLAGPVYLFWKNIFGFDAVISQGANPVAILAVKALLRQIGYQVPDTAFFDQRTHKVVTDFQHRHQIEPDGLVGPLTKMFLVSDAKGYDVPQVVTGQHPESEGGL